ncbi:MAG: hypothetical protein AAF939_19065 [Planctomycetota bacterium]
MNQNKQEKPSPILMLAPIALVLLGYHYLFNAELNTELSSKRDRETSLQQQAADIQSRQTGVHQKLAKATKDLADAKKETESIQTELDAVTEEKKELREVVLGVVNSESIFNKRVANPNGSNAFSAEQTTSTVSQFATMLVSNGTTNPVNQQEFENDSRPQGLTTRMDLICSILGQHNMFRVETSKISSSPTGGLVEKERLELGRLLDAKLPPVSRYKIRLAGSFSNLIAALNQLSESLPSVSVLSISLDPVDLKSRRYLWNLEVGISG